MVALTTGAAAGAEPVVAVAVAVAGGRRTVVMSVVTTAAFRPEHPLTNKSAAPAAANIRRRARPEGRRRDEQRINDM